MVQDSLGNDWVECDDCGWTGIPDDLLENPDEENILSVCPECGGTNISDLEED